MRVISWMVVLGFATACGPRFDVVGPRAATAGCVTPSRVEGTLVVIRSEVPIPQGAPLKIELTRELSGGDGPRVVIDSP